jgi:hypothetical protein
MAVKKEIEDLEKSRYYHEIAAIGGSVTSRTILGRLDQAEDNLHRACKHYMIAAICGDESGKSSRRVQKRCHYQG